MKRISTNIIENTQKKGITLCVQKAIENNFSSSARTKGEFLYNNVKLFKERNLGEPILIQTILKSFFPRSSFLKEDMAHLMDVSKKIIIDSSKEKSDFRFLNELQLCSDFANSYPQIASIICKSEHPKNLSNVLTKIAVGNNKFNDLTLNLVNGFSQDMDVKLGNNANKPFSGILSEIPLTSDGNPYGIINEPLSLPVIQAIRIRKLIDYQENHNVQLHAIQQILHINDLPIDYIQKNILIQEQLFHILSKSLLKQCPSFYFAYFIKNTPTVHALYFEKLSPYITNNIFNNALSSKIFITKAFELYIEVIEDITSQIEKSRNVWQGTGFEHIADDIFK